jgi:hypothetical protein
MTDNDELHTSAYWRDRAEEARVKAGEMRSHDAERSFLEIARMYDNMADRAAKREARLAAESGSTQRVAPTRRATRD